jgi:glycolate oxidase FAD binding subunit
MIGITVAQADGSMVHAGGRVVKNVTGYDLGKLYIGSLGTLGIIVEARFKVLPLPAADRTIVFGAASVTDAVTLSFALDRENLGLKALTLLNGPAASSIGLYTPAVAVRITGEASAVDSIAGQVVRRASETGASPVELSVSNSDLWEAVRQGGIAAGTAPMLALRASMLPTAVKEFIEALEPAASDQLPAVTAIVTYGTVTANWDVDDAPALAVAETALGMAGRFGAQVWLEKAPAEVKQNLDVWGALPESFPLMRRIKHQYDPDGRLNHGRYIGRL